MCAGCLGVWWGGYLVVLVGGFWFAGGMTMNDAEFVQVLGAWGFGRSLARQVPVMEVTPYGWVGLAYFGKSTVRHLIHDVSVVDSLMCAEVAPLTELKLPCAAAEWVGPLREGWQVYQAVQTLMVGPLVGLGRGLPGGYEVCVESHEVWAQADVLFAGERVAHVQCGVSGEYVVFDNVSTSPKHQRRGLASGLMAELSGWAARRGARSGVLVASPEGRLLYERHGYSAVSPMMDIDFVPGQKG